VSGILQLGNMQFKQERNSDQATLPDNTGLSLSQTHPGTHAGAVLALARWGPMRATIPAGGGAQYAAELRT